MCIRQNHLFSFGILQNINFMEIRLLLMWALKQGGGLQCTILNNWIILL